MTEEASNKRPLNKAVLLWWCALAVLGVWMALFADADMKPWKERAEKSITAEAPLTNGAPAASTAETETALRLQQAVLPAAGYTVPLRWGDAGQKLVRSGAIDLEKYQKNYGDNAYAELLTYLTEEKGAGITITAENSYFWVNTLWALGLAQNSDVLEKGIMMTQYKDKLGNFASTGGWTLGAKSAMDLYSSQDIVTLTAEQQALVAKVAAGIYRPCCGNSTAFPDCNHGMAILGLLELMASQGFSEVEMYRASLAFNSYWFPQTYVDLAYYFETKENTPWSLVDPKRALAAEFSSGTGYQRIKSQVGDVPGTPPSAGGCGA